MFLGLRHTIAAAARAWLPPERRLFSQPGNRDFIIIHLTLIYGRHFSLDGIQVIFQMILRFPDFFLLRRSVPVARREYRAAQHSVRCLVFFCSFAVFIVVVHGFPMGSRVGTRTAHIPIRFCRFRARHTGRLCKSNSKLASLVMRCASIDKKRHCSN